MKHLIFILVLSGCGSIKEIVPEQGHGGEESDYSGPCEKKLDPKIEKRNQRLAEAANEQRLVAVAREQERLRASPVKLHEIISGHRGGADDPFPEAQAIFLDEKSEETYGDKYYAQLHGYEGAWTVYETSPGSKQYFIVDEVAGDGAGSVALNRNIGHGDNEGSMHSWHVTNENKLVRLRPLPQQETLSSVSICGCGPNQYESDPYQKLEFEKDAMEAYPKGIFLLPGSAEPTIHDETMDIEYEDHSILIKYVPKKGTACAQVVC